MALVDQVVVSAASFLTTVAIGRYTDPSQLGAYAIGISVLASAFTIQGSLITLPYSIQLHRPLGTPAEHAGNALAHSSLLAAVITLVLTMTAFGLFALGAQPELTAMRIRFGWSVQVISVMNHRPDSRSYRTCGSHGEAEPRTGLKNV